jgi:hypothetical protein
VRTVISFPGEPEPDHSEGYTKKGAEDDDYGSAGSFSIWKVFTIVHVVSSNGLYVSDEPFKGVKSTHQASREAINHKRLNDKEDSHDVTNNAPPSQIMQPFGEQSIQPLASSKQHAQTRQSICQEQEDSRGTSQGVESRSWTELDETDEEGDYHRQDDSPDWFAQFTDGEEMAVREHVVSTKCKEGS